MFKKIVLLLAVISLPLFSQPATASSHASSLKNLGMNEIMFAQGMIPHHQQAIDMSNMAVKNSASPEVKKLAKGIIAAQGKEIAQLKYWLTASKSSGVAVSAEKAHAIITSELEISRDAIETAVQAAGYSLLN